MLLGSSTVSHAALAQSWCVSGNGNDALNGKTPKSAVRQLQKATDLTMPGDTVFVMNSTYNSTTRTLLNVTRSGTAAGHITYNAMREHKPKIKASKTFGMQC